MKDNVRAALGIAFPGHDFSSGESNVQISCPFHAGGQEKNPSCSVSLSKPVFHCFACGAHGHISKLLKQVNSPESHAERVGAAYKSSVSTVAASVSKDPYRGIVLPEAALHLFKGAPKAYLDDGFHERTLWDFEVTVDMFNLRYIFPLRNVYGDLIGVSGRAVMDDEVPRYDIYSLRRWIPLARQGRWSLPSNYTMEKKGFLYNGHRVVWEDTPDSIIVCEGFKACMWVAQAGFKHAVALAGSALTKLQANLLARTGRPVVLFMDNDPPGIMGAWDAIDRLGALGVNVTVARYPRVDESPDDLSEDEVNTAITGALRPSDWRNKNR